MNKTLTTEQDYSVIVVGAGMTGIAAGYYLGRRGIPYTILEAKSDLGGVWNSHRWHGVRCDSDVIKYSFSFQPYLSDECLQGGANLKGYLHAVAQEFGVLRNIRFHSAVIKAAFDPVTQLWSVHTLGGVHTARFLINGNGYYADEPYVPRFEGTDRFKGELVHTSHLDGARTFHGRNVVVVGSGATAICCAPELARVSASVVLLQRSPSYIYELDNRAGGLFRTCQVLYRRGLRFPVRWLRRYLQLRDDLVFVGFRRFPQFARAFFRRHWLPAVGETALKEHFTPRYNPWEQRIPVATGMKEALRSGSLRMKTAQIERFEESGIVLKGGERLPCDVCVLATGLNVRFFSFDLYVGGAKVAVERINFQKGLMPGGVPNYFQPMGSWHTAWTERLEPLLRSAIRIMTYMRERGLGVVSVERREVPCQPGITPNYVLRSLATMPRPHGLTNIPSIDNLFAGRFDPASFDFFQKDGSVTLTDYVIDLVLSAILVIGAYQFYFWCQRNPLVTPRELKLRIDEWIPYWPSWVWIYSFLYYPVILYLNFVIDSPRQFTYVATSYMLLLGLQMVFFVLFPVATPPHWRTYNLERSLSERLLAMVQRMDARSNSFPSMHVSVAMLTAMHLLPHMGAIALVFPVVIALSCLFTKQHYVIDMPAGALLGWGSFGAYRVLL